MERRGKVNGRLMRKISIKYMKLKGDYVKLAEKLVDIYEVRGMYGLFIPELLIIASGVMYGIFIPDFMTRSSRELIKEEVITELKKDINDIEGCINDLDMSLEEVRNSDLWDRIGA